MTSARRGSLGLPLLEIGIVFVLTGVFVGVLRHQLLYYWELAERTTVQLTLANMRSGLRLEMARRLMTGQAASIPALSSINPMHLLHAPDNYLGERPRVNPQTIPPGYWVFSQQNGHLYYRPRHQRYLEQEGAQELAFLEFVLESGNKSSEASANGATQPGVLPGDVRLVSVRPYRWF